MLERIKQSLSEQLPAWLVDTPTGRKLLAEKEAFDRKQEEQAVADRKELVAQLEAARAAEREDTELRKLIAERDEFEAKAPKKPKTRMFQYGTDVNTLEKMNRRINSRRRTHRDAVDALRRQLIDSAPAWLSAAVTEFCGRLDTLRNDVCAIAAKPVEVKYGFDGTGTERPVKVLDFRGYQREMLGSTSTDKGWLAAARSQASKLLVTASTREEVTAQLKTLWANQPARKPAWRNVV